MPSHLPVPTPASIHAVRQEARRALVRLRVLRPAVDRNSLKGLHASLQSLLHSTADSRNAHVQRRLVARLRADCRRSEVRGYNPLLAKLRSRERVASARLARYLRSEIGADLLRRANEALSVLRVSQANADLRRLAARRFHRELHKVDALLAHRLPAGHRVHPLRIRIRRARDLVFLLDAPLVIDAAELNEGLNRMQDALGDWRDSKLLGRWVHERALMLSPHLRGSLENLQERRRKRCKRRRKPLREAIRRFLRMTRP